MIPLASSLVLNIGAIAGAIATVIAGLIAVWKMGPERDHIFITNEQGAQVIMRDVVDTLREEIARVTEKANRLQVENDKLISENERLEAANRKLRRKYGERHGDSDADV